MTYFHRRPSTIIGAKAFHCPVRDGKEWDHLAMVVKRNRVSLSLCSGKDQSGKKHASSALAPLAYRIRVYLLVSGSTSRDGIAGGAVVFTSGASLGVSG